MLRKVAIGLAAAVIATGGATLTAAAAHGSGGDHGGGGHEGYSGHGDGHYGSMKGDRYGMDHGVHGYRYRPEWKYHHYYGPRWGYERHYYGGGSCWRNVWTVDGWQRQWVCGYGRPYGSTYDYYRGYRGGWGGHHMQYPGRPDRHHH
jgi:hypothetical protein